MTASDLRRRQRGLTLLELLVTLVIAAAAIALLGQAVWQLYRVESLLADDRLRGQTVVLRAEWVRQALAGLQPTDGSGRGALVGQERELTGFTSNPIARSAGGFGALALRLRFDPEAGETVLETDMPSADGASAQVLLRWPGDSGRFVYLRADGSTEPAWPPPLGKWPSLPAAVVLQTALPGFHTLVAVPLMAERSQPSRREFEKL